MMSKHTQEPWAATDRAIKRDNGFGYGEIIANVPGGNTSGPFFVQCDEECEANARRIVSCVNACAGMADPAAEIAELKRQRDEFVGLMELIASEIPFRQGKNGNCPWHGHSEPGIWDDDNGALSGKECGLCKAWNMAVEFSNKAKEMTK